MKTEEGKNTHVSHQHTEPTVKLIKWGDLDLWKQDSTTTKKNKNQPENLLYYFKQKPTG